MYKVLIVDDERIAREGVRDAIDWDGLGAMLCGMARNGLEARALIESERPEIVITDVKMPGLNGLELIAEVRGEYPETQFVVLSGYGEFEFAKTAMQYGVKYYLLKPCNEKKVQGVLQDVAAEIEQRKTREAYLQKIRADFTRIMPQLKGQVLREFTTNASYGRQEWDYYRDLCGLELDGRHVRLILCQLEGEFDFESLFALQKVAEDICGRYACLSTTVGERLLILIDETEMETVLSLAHRIKRAYLDYYERDLTIAVSESSGIENLQSLFKETGDYLKHRFYLGEGSIITKKDVGGDERDEPELVYDFDRMGTLVKSGDLEGLGREFEAFFDRLHAAAYDFRRTKTYCLDLYMAVIRGEPVEKLQEYLERMPALVSMDTLEQMCGLIEEIALAIAEGNYSRATQRHSEQVGKVITLVNEHMGQEELSLKWLAREMLYMNVDYLGKLFKMEMNERFTDFVLRVRMEKAKELLAVNENKIFEIAEQVGFGKNTQYFSQVFKKSLGCTPTEYRKRLV